MYHLGIVIVVLIILIIYNWQSSYSLYGFWTADDEFLEDAGLTSIALFIGDPDGSIYPSYLFMSNDEGAIEDQKIDLHLSKMRSSDGAVWYSGKALTTNTWDEDIQVRVCPKRHLLTVMHEKTIYAELYKDNILTDHSRSV